MAEDPGSSRRHFLGHFLFPTLAGCIAGGLSGVAGTVWANRYKDRHDLSISIIKSGNANLPDEVADASPFIVPFGPPPVTIEATPDPNGYYTYTVIIRNNGNFPETDLAIAFSFESDTNQTAPVAVTSLDATSPLLRETVQVQPLDIRHMEIMAPQLNPGEWISYAADCTIPFRVSVQLRSNNISVEANG